MSLVVCPECGHEVSTYAECCPNCGCPSRMFADKGAREPGGIAPDDHIEFGKYPQTRHKDVFPIEWRVMKVYDGRAQIMSEYALDARCFNESEKKGNDWGESDLCKWLNGEFKKTAFTEEEAGIIDGEILCLSVGEADRLFEDDNARKCKPTEYAVYRHAISDSDRGDTCIWWLRSAGAISTCAADVNSAGAINAHGASVDYPKYAVRPMCWIRLL